jgi:hypothetical protein
MAHWIVCEERQVFLEREQATLLVEVTLDPLRNLAKLVNDAHFPRS